MTEKKTEFDRKKCIGANEKLTIFNDIEKHIFTSLHVPYLMHGPTFEIKKQNKSQITRSALFSEMIITLIIKNNNNSLGETMLEETGTRRWQ